MTELNRNPQTGPQSGQPKKPSQPQSDRQQTQSSPGAQKQQSPGQRQDSDKMDSKKSSSDSQQRH